MQTNKAFLVVAVLVVAALGATALFLMNDGPTQGDTAEAVEREAEKARAVKNLPPLEPESDALADVPVEEGGLEILEADEFVNATWDNPDVGRPTFVRTRDTMGNIIVAQQQWHASKATNDKQPQKLRGVARLSKARKHPGGLKIANRFSAPKKDEEGEKKEEDDSDRPSVGGDEHR